MCTGVNNGSLEKPVLNQFRRIEVCITDVANTQFYVEVPGDSMENGSNGLKILRKATILRKKKTGSKWTLFFLEISFLPLIVLKMTKISGAKLE